MTMDKKTQALYIEGWIGDETDARIDTFTIPFSERLTREVLSGAWRGHGYEQEYKDIRNEFLLRAKKAIQALKEARLKQYRTADPISVPICFHYRLICSIPAYRSKSEALLVRIYLQAPDIPPKLTLHIQNELGEINRLAILETARRRQPGVEESTSGEAPVEVRIEPEQTLQDQITIASAARQPVEAATEVKDYFSEHPWPDKATTAGEKPSGAQIQSGPAAPEETLVAGQAEETVAQPEPGGQAKEGTAPANEPAAQREKKASLQDLVASWRQRKKENAQAISAREPESAVEGLEEKGALRIGDIGELETPALATPAPVTPAPHTTEPATAPEKPAPETPIREMPALQMPVPGTAPERPAPEPPALATAPETNAPKFPTPALAPGVLGVDVPPGAPDEKELGIIILDETPDDDLTLIGEPPARIGRLQIVMRNTALEAARRHASEDTTRETGGVLIGKFITEPNGDVTVLVTSILRAHETIRQTSSLTFTPATWARIWQVIDNNPLYSNDQVWKMVGWYHTHPSFGIFLSSFDLSIHHQFFTDPNHIALVIDPLRRQHGFFCWNQAHTRVDKIAGMADPISEKQLKELYLVELEQLPPSEIG